MTVLLIVSMAYQPITGIFFGHVSVVMMLNREACLFSSMSCSPSTAGYGWQPGKGHT